MKLQIRIQMDLARMKMNPMVSNNHKVQYNNYKTIIKKKIITLNNLKMNYKKPPINLKIKNQNSIDKKI